MNFFITFIAARYDRGHHNQTYSHTVFSSFFSMLSEYKALGSGRAYATSRERKSRRVRPQTLAEKLRSSLTIRNKEIVARVLCLVMY
jgi:hypothetical protein